MKRVIGEYIGKANGPMLLAIGGLHGNEKAGIDAINKLLILLQLEATKHPDFQFKGQFIGLLGNKQAIIQGKRFISRDMNRLFVPEHIALVKGMPNQQLYNEDLELKEFILTIERLLHQYQPTKLVVLDLHTTSSSGGIFSIVTDQLRSLQIAVNMHAPVITDLLKGLRGTSLHYFSQLRLPIEVMAIAFEAGQHEEVASVDRSISAMVSCLRTIGCVEKRIVESKHDELLREYARYLPRVVQFRYVHHIQPDDNFVMQPGYQNFQKVTMGELLAHDQHGAIHAKESGRILMPLYQTQGEDGFFIVKEMEEITY